MMHEPEKSDSVVVAGKGAAEDHRPKPVLKNRTLGITPRRYAML